MITQDDIDAMCAHTLNDLAREVHEQNVKVGWWDKWIDDKHGRFDTAMMLVASELAEAMEGDRKDLMDTHLPHHKMFDVELADTAIRLLDLAGAYDVDLSNIERDAVSIAREFGLCDKTRIEQLWFVLSTMCSYVREKFKIRFGLAGVFAVAHFNGIDLMPLIAEKREYNAHRQDHRRDVRAAAGGKAY